MYLWGTSSYRFLSRSIYSDITLPQLTCPLEIAKKDCSAQRLGKDRSECRLSRGGGACDLHRVIHLESLQAAPDKKAPVTTDTNLSAEMERSLSILLKWQLLSYQICDFISRVRMQSHFCQMLVSANSQASMDGFQKWLECSSVIYSGLFRWW